MGATLLQIKTHMTDCIIYILLLTAYDNPSDFAVVNVNTCHQEVAGFDMTGNIPSQLKGRLLDKTGLIEAELPDGTSRIYEPYMKEIPAYNEE